LQEWERDVGRVKKLFNKRSTFDREEGEGGSDGSLLDTKFEKGVVL